MTHIIITKSWRVLWVGKVNMAINRRLNLPKGCFKDCINRILA